MKKRIKNLLYIKKILLFSLVFCFCFVISCEVEYVEYCSVNITSPKTGTNFIEGDTVHFSAYIQGHAKDLDNLLEPRIPQIAMVKWTSDRDGDLETQTYDPSVQEVTHFFTSDSLSVNVHEIKCTTFSTIDSYDFECSNSILININEKTTTTTALIDLSLFKHAQITLRTVKELLKSDEDPIEDKSTDVLIDYGYEGSFSGYEYSAAWFVPADRVTNVEMTGSISITLSSTENAVTSAEYHWKQEDLDEDNAFKHTRDFEMAGKSGIPMTNSSSSSLTFRVDGFEVCNHIGYYETEIVTGATPANTITTTRTHSYCDENSVLEIYLSQ